MILWKISKAMSSEDKFETIYGTWINGSDVEDPDELVDPTGWHDWLASSKQPSDLAIFDSESETYVEPGEEDYQALKEDQENIEDDDSWGDSDWEDLDDDLLDLLF